jgi:hypothetical protein
MRQNAVTALLCLLVAMQVLTLWFAISANSNARLASISADDAYSAARSAYEFAEKAAYEAEDAAEYAEYVADRMRRIAP